MKVLFFILLSVLEVSGSIPANPQDGSSLAIKNTRHEGDSQTARTDNDRMLRRLAAYGELWCEASDLKERLEFEMDDDPTYNLYLGDSARGEAPSGVQCSQSNEYGTCPALVYNGIDEDDFRDYESIVPPSRPTTHDVPCTKCDFHYHKDSSTYVAPCSSFDFKCLPPDNEDGTTPSFVTVQYKVKRSDFFRTVQYTSPYSYSPSGWPYICTLQGDKKSYQVDFLKGVTNFRSTTLLVLPDSSCSYSVDGVACSSCRTCDGSDRGLFELDCSNVRSGAIASCNQNVVNPYYGYFPKLLKVQEGFEFPPTEAPTPQPSPDPTQPSIDPPPPGPTDSDEEEGLPVSKGVLKTVIWIVAMGLFIGSMFIYSICTKKKERNSITSGRRRGRTPQQQILPSYSTPPPPSTTITTTQAPKQVEECSTPSIIASSTPPVGERVSNHAIEETAEKPVMNNIITEGETSTVDNHHQEEQDDDGDDTKQHSSKKKKNNKTTDGDESRRHRHHHRRHHRHGGGHKSESPHGDSTSSSGDGNKHRHHHHRHHHRSRRSHHPNNNNDNDH